MAITKKAAETEVKAAETVAAPAAEKKAAEKKAPAKKTAAKKTTAAKKETTAKKITENVYVEYQGVQLNSASLIERAKKESGVKAPKSVNVYVKPEDNKVYYVVDNNAGDFSLVD